MILGYNTNGMAHHDPRQAIELLAEIGYQSVALTLDHGLLNPYSESLPRQLDEMRPLLRRLRMRSVVETGARYLLDPRRKHQPTLVSHEPDERARRIDFLKRAVEIARHLESDCVSLWSGAASEAENPEMALDRLASGLEEVLDNAAGHQGKAHVVLAFEPEPDMLVATLADYRQLQQRMAGRLRLTLDVGHVHCQNEGPLPQLIKGFGDEIANVHIEDMRRGVHEHLAFGEGEMEFPPIIDALARAGYAGGLHVELSRHSHMAPTAAQKAYDFLSPLVRAARR